MTCKKSFLAVLAMLTPSAASAQTGADLLRQSVLEAQQAQAQRQDVQMRNEIMVLESRLRADDAVSRIERSTRQPSAGEGATPPAPAPRMVAIPDAALAASRARIEAISGGR